MLAGRSVRRLEVDGFHPAAVLVPILQRPAGPSILLTQRTETVNHHKGQISFPGGRIELDEGLEPAALRETQEEVGLPPTAVEIVGALDDYPSTSGYVVSPFVGMVPDPPPELRPQEAEVQDLFEVPLTHFLREGCLRMEWWEVGERTPPKLQSALHQLGPRLEDYDSAGRRYRVFFFDVDEDRVVWGLTARILKDLLVLAFGLQLPADHDLR